MIEKLITMNENLIKIYKNQPESLKRQELIKKILTEPNVFLKINIATAYKILEDLEINPPDIPKVYDELIDITNYNQNENSQ